MTEDIHLAKAPIVEAVLDRSGREKLDRGISDKAALNRNKGYQA